MGYGSEIFNDYVDFTRLTNQEFIDHINRVGIPFYKQGELVELA